MRCGKCRKNFDEEMYSGICPKCGYFNDRQADYDVSKYFSATFDDGAKTSTSTQAAKQHEQLHRMYDAQNMHKAGADSHEKLHEKYDKKNMHSQGQNQINVEGAAGTYGRNKYEKVNAHSKEKKKNWITPICIVMSVLAIAVTVGGIRIKKQILAERYGTLNYEQVYAEAGEVFAINERLLLVNKAEVIDTSMIEGMPIGEKLIAVTVEILPTEDWDGEPVCDRVCAVADATYKMPLDSDTLESILNSAGYSVSDSGDDLPEKLYGLQELIHGGLLTGYDYLDSDSQYGKTGKFLFFVEKEEEYVFIYFDEEKMKNGIPIMQKRAGVLLEIEENER